MHYASCIRRCTNGPAPDGWQGMMHAGAPQLLCTIGWVLASHDDMRALVQDKIMHASDCTCVLQSHTSYRAYSHISINMYVLLILNVWHVCTHTHTTAKSHNHLCAHTSMYSHALNHLKSCKKRSPEQSRRPKCTHMHSGDTHTQHSPHACREP